MDRVNKLVKRYRKEGFSPFPLATLSKVPPKGSKLATIDKDWPFDENSNIGLFPGSPNKLAVIDADTEQTQRILEGKLNDMGVYGKTTRVRTPKRGGTHYWLRVFGVPSWVQSYYNLAPELGRGELRLRRPAYVVGPRSILPEGEYQFELGGIDTFMDQPIVIWKDIMWLLPPIRPRIEEKEHSGLLSIPVRLNYQPYPNALHLLARLKRASKGASIQKVDYKTGELLDRVYKSRSEAEAAVVTNLVLAGWSFDEILRIFNDELPGHFAEARNPRNYLRGVYKSVIQFLITGDKRERIATAYSFASLNAWPGRGGEYEQRVLLAILSKAWQFNTYHPTASLREIGEHAAINRLNTIRGVLERLCRAKIIRIIETEPFWVSRFDIQSFVEDVNNCNINTNGRNVNYVSVIDTPSWKTAELWGNGLLGGSAKLVYSHLSDKIPISVSELIKRTGKCRSTVKTALTKRLHPSELAMPVEGGWIRGDANLEELAEKIGANNRANERRQKHKRERQAYDTRKIEYMKSRGEKQTFRSG